MGSDLSRGVPRTDFWNGTSIFKQYSVLPKNGSKYYLEYTFLAFPILGILGLGTLLDLRPFTITYEVYLRYLGRGIKGVVFIAECAGEDLP